MNAEVIKNGLPFLLEGALVTFEISILAILIGTVLGFVLCMMRLSHIRLVQQIAFTYIWLFRGLPLLIILFLFYYAAPSIGITLTAFEAGLLGMSLNAAAYKAEIIRSGMLAVQKGQIEAAEAIGMNPFQIMFRIRIPQVIRLIIPPYINNSVVLLKESAQVSVITVPDLMLNAQTQYSSTYLPLETLGVAAVLYLIMTSSLMLVQTWTEKKLKVAQNNR
ncbi:amino acid ABC transporter permease [Paenibacillus agricola]|uniref:Amino acid ABC transporter permease n=1 Tax=Paenibacillus agricola TaxID=2716264 RepID=A0ABX0JDC2_9BACL|nr:amino acid ABC transporter permease [Paenibacillus agricola]NHN34157.1 amino acid ABC transporter permease [Paenibacillus agricola]